MEPTPPFEIAVDLFKGFLRKHGLTPDLLWRRSEDIIRLWDGRIFVRRRDPDSAAAWARSYFDSGRQHELGIGLDATCALGGAVCATVFWTNDPIEASYQLMPDRGLKLTVADPLPRGNSVPLLRWFVVRWTMNVRAMPRSKVL